ncbi:hypothetical protein B0H12DRAFT_90072 [Mycena haematopus]|nr:hypothetical protein B0H12DRAFT_90072 [Mycena haematopus]
MPPSSPARTSRGAMSERRTCGSIAEDISFPADNYTVSFDGEDEKRVKKPPQSDASTAGSTTFFKICFYRQELRSLNPAPYCWHQAHKIIVFVPPIGLHCRTSDNNGSLVDKGWLHRRPTLLSFSGQALVHLCSRRRVSSCSMSRGERTPPHRRRQRKRPLA